jgi:hypothetical protein
MNMMLDGAAVTFVSMGSSLISITQVEKTIRGGINIRQKHMMPERITAAAFIPETVLTGESFMDTS